MDLKSIALAIRHFGKTQAFTRGKACHSHLIKHGISRDGFIANSLLFMYVDFSLLEDAQKLFDEMPDRNVVSWTIMASAYTSNGSPSKAIGLYTQMLNSDSETPNGFMYSTVLKACGLVGNIELGKLIHGRIHRHELDDDVVLMNSILDMYAKCGSLSTAKKAFHVISRPNSTSWNTVISGYCKAGLMQEAVSLFHQMPEPNVVSWNSIISGFADSGSSQALEFSCAMHKEGLSLDFFTLPCALKACSYLVSLAIGKQLHCYVLKSGLEASSYILSALVDMYSNCNVLNEATVLFDQYSSHYSRALWNSMLSGFVFNEDNRSALELLSRIYHLGLCIDSYTFSTAAKICVNLLHLGFGLQVHCLVITSGFELDYVVGSILIDFYVKLRRMQDALALFDHLPYKDTVAWSALIIGCAKTEFSNLLAFSLFRDMVELQLGVDQFIISSILKVCSSLTSIGRGKQVHALCIKVGFEAEAVTSTSLIDMYSKCGEIDEGLALFGIMEERDVVCWTGIIVGCGQNGKSKEAIELFHEMTQSRLKPNEVTFLGVLSACRHAGLVEAARAIFEVMKPNYGLEPHYEHYYCMVDLLGQAGLFAEAEKLISNMSFEPDKTIWSSLLAACGTHRNTKLVSYVAEKLITKCPKDHSVYVMISNAYATLGMWDHLSEVREAAKEMGIKEAGRSWIEV